MKTKYLDNEIELLNSIKRNNEISDYGQEKLNEFNEIKKQLTLTDVSHLLIAWEQYKKANWWESESVDVEKYLMEQFEAIYCG